MRFTNPDGWPTPDWLYSGRIPALDGFRGVAIGLVLLSHAGSSAGWRLAQAGQPLSFGGLIGVDLFFIISGFLITILFIREWERSGRINLQAFYLRRSLRILPASYAYLIFVACLVAFGVCRIPNKQWIATLLYLINFFSNPAKAILHFWSLSIEEQFYLLWPPLFATLIARRKGTILVIVVAWSLASAAAGRLAMLTFWPEYYGASRWWTPLRLDGIAAGCLLGLIAHEDNGIDRLDRFSQWWPAFIVACVSFQIGGRRFTPYIAAFVPTLEVAGMAGILWSTIRAGPRWLDRGPLALLGVLSYSIYLWQQPFLLPDHPNWWSSWPQNLFLSLGFAMASHHIIERPFLRLKGWIGRLRPEHASVNP